MMEIETITVERFFRQSKLLKNLILLLLIILALGFVICGFFLIQLNSSNTGLKAISNTTRVVNTELILSTTTSNVYNYTSSTSTTLKPDFWNPI